MRLVGRNIMLVMLGLALTLSVTPAHAASVADQGASPVSAARIESAIAIGNNLPVAISDGQMRQLQTLTPRGRDTSYVSVAVDGDTAVVGIQQDDAAAIDGGAVYVYERTGITWSQTQVLTASDAAEFDWFGHAVALEGDTAIVTAHNGESAAPDSGCAYVFTRSAGVWTQTAKLVGADSTSGDRFGISAALDGDRLLIGADHNDPGGVSNAGAAYVFHNVLGTWLQTQKLTAAGGGAEDWFGWSVALDGDSALVGACFDDVLGVSNAGSVYAFAHGGGVWGQTQQISAGDRLANDLFGFSLALDGDTALVGAEFGDKGATTNVGAVYVLNRSGGTWSQAQKLNASDAALGDHFGYSVALAGPQAVIGANWEDPAGQSNAGSAYYFTRGAATWTEDAHFVPAESQAAGSFGSSVAFDGQSVFAGSDSNLSSAYVFGKVFTTAEDTDLAIGAPGVLANDSDADGDTLRPSVVSTDSLHGRVNLGDDGAFTYAPPADWNGVTNWAYRDSDGAGESNVATITVVVTPVNDPPVAMDDAVETSHDAPVTISLVANDADVDTPNGSLVATSISGPTVGAVEVVSATEVRYTPPAGYTGPASFTYCASDGDGLSQPATVSITVVNHAPVLTVSTPLIPAEAAGALAAPGNGVTVASILGDSVSDADGDPVGMAVSGIKLRDGVWQFSLDGGATWADVVSASTHGALLLRPADRVRFVSYFNTGTTSLTYRAWDGTQGSAGEPAQIAATGGAAAFSADEDVATLDVDLPWIDKVGRLSGRDRFATSVATARYASHDWEAITDLVLVSGDDANASDPLAAAGLIWAYRGAPMIQTSPRALPSSLRDALYEIAEGNSTIRIHVVGGTVALPEARVTEIEAVLRGRGVEVSHDRVAGRNRYATAAAIAATMAELRGDEMSGDVLIAHGAIRERFFDALALSPVAATQGSPILLTPAAALASETVAAITTLEPERVVVAGGTAVVSQAAFDSIASASKERWAGSDRFGTAVEISNHAIAEGMLSARTVTVCSARADASSLPDALASSTVSEGDASPLLLVQSDVTPQVAGTWLADRRSAIRHVWLIGGERVITLGQEICIGDLVKE